MRNEARFEDSVGVFPEFIDGYNILILPTTGRYFQVRRTYMRFTYQPMYLSKALRSYVLAALKYCTQFKVPYGCLQPAGLENLLVAGRCVAGDMVGDFNLDKVTLLVP